MDINRFNNGELTGIWGKFPIFYRFRILFCRTNLKITGHRILLLMSFIVLFSGNMIHAFNLESTECEILPQLSRTFISKNFPEVQVAHIEKEDGLFKMKCYHVILTNGVDIHFKQADGEWVQINGVTGDFPLNILPKLLVEYVTEEYPGKRIVIVAKKDDNYIIKLENDVELLFNKKGKLSTD